MSLFRDFAMLFIGYTIGHWTGWGRALTEAKKEDGVLWVVEEA